MNFLQKFIRNILERQIWQFVGVIVGLIAIVITLWLDRANRDIKELTVSTVINSSLVEIEPVVARDIQVLYKNREVHNLSLIVVRIENTGNVEIRTSDYERPISLEFFADSTVVEATLTDANPPAMAIDIDINNNIATLENVLYNPGDWVAINFLIIDNINEGQVGIRGRIAGLQLQDFSVEGVNNEDSNNPIGLATILNIILVFIILGIGISRPLYKWLNS